MDMDKLTEFLNKYYGNNAEALVFGVGEDAFPPEYHKHLEGLRLWAASTGSLMPLRRQA